MTRLPFLVAAGILLGLALGCSQQAANPPHPRATTQQAGAPTGGKLVAFSTFDAGNLPAGFSQALTGGGGPVSWLIQDDATAPSGKRVLAQTSTDRTDGRYPLCIYDGLIAKDVTVAVQFKAVSGEVDRAAGLVVRCKDKNNYYVVRANALEDNVRLYVVKDGKRKQFAGVDAKVSSGQWHSLGLQVRGSHFIVRYDGKVLFEADDATFAGAGKVGLWTKADSVTCFDNLKIGQPE